jgi:hypothetical protein
MEEPVPEVRDFEAGAPGFAGVVCAVAAAVKAAKDRKRTKRFIVRNVSD